MIVFMKSARQTKAKQQAEAVVTDADHHRYNELREFFCFNSPGENFDTQVELMQLVERFQNAGFETDPLPW